MRVCARCSAPCPSVHTHTHTSHTNSIQRLKITISSRSIVIQYTFALSPFCCDREDRFLYMVSQREFFAEKNVYFCCSVCCCRNQHLNSDMYAYEIWHTFGGRKRDAADRALPGPACQCGCVRATVPMLPCASGKMVLNISLSALLRSYYRRYRNISGFGLGSNKSVRTRVAIIIPMECFNLYGEVGRRHEEWLCAVSSL